MGFPDLTLVFSTEVFNDYIDGQGLAELYEDDDWERVQRTIEATPFSDGTLREIGRVLDRFDEIGSPPLAIRSSSLFEDSVSLAFAEKYEIGRAHV